MPTPSLTPVLGGMLVLALSAPASAQVAQPGLSPSAGPAGLVLDVPTYFLPRPEVERMQQEDAERADWPLRYGAVIGTALSSQDAGAWETTASGELVWRIHLVSPGARSLGVLFDQFELPASGRVFLYDQKGETVLGAFTRATRQPNGKLAVQPVLGDELWIEYAQDAREPAPRLRIGEVVHDYRGILDALRVDAPLALLGGGCLVDANCPEAQANYEVKDAVIMVLMGGGLCSAGLLNNTANDGTPYFLTADHCGDMTNVVAVFDYERTGCGTGPSPQSRTISGATLLAESSTYDSQLYRLSSAPPASYKPFYAGWDRNPVQSIGAVSISHPSGLPRKYAREDQKPRTKTTRFEVSWDLAHIEGGSSGSPLFNAQRRVIGPACCVDNFTCGNQISWYGRFDRFYDVGNLGQWLDPLGTDPLSIDGFEPFRGQAVSYNGSDYNPVVFFSTSRPSLGSTWTATIDGSFIGLPMMTSIVFHTAPRAGVFLGAGELLVDYATPRLYTSYKASGGGIALHSNGIPNLPSLIGLTVYTQGILNVGGSRFFTNGMALHLK